MHSSSTLFPHSLVVRVSCFSPSVLSLCVLSRSLGLSLNATPIFCAAFPFPHAIVYAGLGGRLLRGCMPCLGSPCVCFSNDSFAPPSRSGWYVFLRSARCDLPCFDESLSMLFCVAGFHGLSRSRAQASRVFAARAATLKIFCWVRVVLQDPPSVLYCCRLFHFCSTCNR